MLRDKNHGTSVPVKTLLNTASSIPPQKGRANQQLEFLAEKNQSPKLNVQSCLVDILCAYLRIGASAHNFQVYE